MYYWNDNTAQSHQLQLRKILPFTQLYEIEILKHKEQYNTEPCNNNNKNKYNTQKNSVDKTKDTMYQEDLFKCATDPKTNEKCTSKSRIEKAKLYFVQSGILGPNNFKDSSDLIRKTSTIHIDTSLRNQIRKTSLCLRSSVASEREKSYDDSLLNLQAEINLMRGTLDHGDIKIITLRTEIGKLKRILQKIMHVQMEDRNNHSGEMWMKIQNPRPSLCLFCQPK